MKKLLFPILTLTLFISTSAFAQDTCDKDVLSQCKSACDSAQPGCSSLPPALTLAEIRALVAEQCKCTITEADDTADTTDTDTCSCESSVRNFGAYRSCVAKISDATKTFKLTSQENRDALKADNSLCKAFIKDNKPEKGNNGNNGKGGKKE